jgi:hypothetical protein
MNLSITVAFNLNPANDSDSDEILNDHGMPSEILDLTLVIDPETTPDSETAILDYLSDTYDLSAGYRLDEIYCLGDDVTVKMHEPDPDSDPDSDPVDFSDYDYPQICAQLTGITTLGDLDSALDVLYSLKTERDAEILDAAIGCNVRSEITSDVPYCIVYDSEQAEKQAIADSYIERHSLEDHRHVLDIDAIYHDHCSGGSAGCEYNGKVYCFEGY